MLSISIFSALIYAYHMILSARIFSVTQYVILEEKNQHQKSMVLIAFLCDELKIPCFSILFCKLSIPLIYLFLVFLKLRAIQIWLPFVCRKLQCPENLFDKRERRRIVIEPGVRVSRCFEKIVYYCYSFFLRVILTQTILLIDITSFYYSSSLERRL